MLMQRQNRYILSINCGSSSIKFSVFAFSNALERVLTGQVKSSGPKTFLLSSSSGYSGNISAGNIKETSEALFDWLEQQINFKEVAAVGHRIVHGMNHTDSELITQTTLESLEEAIIIDPDHLPAALALIRLISLKYPKMKQIACYDTAFHKQLPQVAGLFALPRKFEKEGIKRYGFHGLSYSYIIEKLKTDQGLLFASGRLILMHLGSGASMCAVSDFKSIDTTMGFTPSGGLMMGTRSGDLDPGIILYLIQKNGLDVHALDKLLNKESGLLGVSGRTGDMHELLGLEDTDPNAASAITLFCYQAKKNLCAYIGVLGGVDAIVFTGGIGENLPEIRSRICSGLEFMGIELNQIKNSSNKFLISGDNKIPVYVIKTDEEYMIAQLTRELID